MVVPLVVPASPWNRGRRTANLPVEGDRIFRSGPIGLDECGPRPHPDYRAATGLLFDVDVERLRALGGERMGPSFSETPAGGHVAFGAAGGVVRHPDASGHAYPGGQRPMGSCADSIQRLG